MATPVTYNAVQYSIPAYQDTGYAQGAGNLSSYLIALATGSLTLAGGTFTLTADADFGANFGLKSIYYKSRSASVASTGTVRLARTEFIAWRDQSGGNDLELAVNASDQLTYNGAIIASSGGALNGTTLTLTATSNQMVIGTTNTTTLSFTAPAASRTYTFPDAGGNVEVVLAGGTQTIAGAKTFSSAVTVTPTSNQLVLGTTRTVTITAPTPASSSRTWTIPDISGDGTFVALSGAQTFTGAKTFTDQTLLLQETGSTDTITIAVAALSASRTYTMPDAGGSASFVLTAGSQSIGGAKTFTNSTTTFQISTAGTAALVFVNNSDNSNTDSHAELLLETGGASGGDSFIRLYNNVANWSIGMDNSDSDALCITNASTLDGSNLLRIVAAGIGFGTDTSTTRSNGGAAVQGSVANTSNTASSTAVFSVAVAGGTASDAYHQWTVTGVTDFVAGIDNSASDAWVLSGGTALGTNNAISISATTYAVAIRGTNTNDTATTGFVGETQQSVIARASGTSAGSSGQWWNVTSISLTAGDWLVTGTPSINANGATVTANTSAGAVSINSGNTTTDHVASSNVFDMQVTPGAAADAPTWIPSYRLSLNATTTVYLKALASFSVATPQGYGRITAVRIR